MFVLNDNHVFIVPYPQQYINTSLTTLDKSMFSCGQIYIDMEFFSLIQHELSHQILNITSFGNAKGKILSQFSLRQLGRHVEPSKNIYRGWSGSKRKEDRPKDREK